jgi:Icc protein
MESRGIDELGLMDREGFVRVIDRHPNVKGVAWGHAHQSLDVLSRGIRWMCTPATCMQFKPRQPGFEVDDRPPGYRVIDLLPDGGIVTEVVWLEGYRK